MSPRRCRLASDALDRQPTLEGSRLLLHPIHDRWRKPVFRAFFANALTGGDAPVAISKASGTVLGTSRWHGYGPANGGTRSAGCRK